MRFAVSKYLENLDATRADFVGMFYNVQMDTCEALYQGNSTGLNCISWILRALPGPGA